MKSAFCIVAAACLLAIGPSALAHTPLQQSAASAKASGPADIGIDPDSSLRSRIGPPDRLVLETYAGSGASRITNHDLTDEEWARVDAALARLPELHRRILQQHLKRLSFLDLEPGAGSALTSKVGSEESSMAFAITLRASLLKETLTGFLNAKETNLFVADASGYRIEFDAGHTDALTYVLIHESTHIVDQVLGLTADDACRLMAGTWESARVPVAAYGSSLAAQTRFRGAKKIAAGEAPNYYRALSQTPFVTFYATAAAAEDVAELFAWQRLSTLFDQTLTLSVVDGTGRTVFRYEPLETPLVKQRFVAVQEILDEPRPQPAAKALQSQGRITTQGARIWYGSIGAGPPVLLLHGGMASSRSWDGQVDHLVKAGYRVVLIDSRGHGRSTLGDRPLSYQLLADDVLAVIDQLQLEKPAVVGWSDGGIVALLLAMRASERLSGVYAFGANMDHDGVRPDAAEAPILKQVAPRLVADYAALSPDPDGFAALHESVRAMQQAQPDVGAAQLRAIHGLAITIAGAERDEFIKPEHPAHLARVIPGATLEMFANTGHFAPWEQPEAFNRSLTAFLANQSTRSRSSNPGGADQ